MHSKILPLNKRGYQLNVFLVVIGSISYLILIQQDHLCAMLLCSIAHSIICTQLFCGKMHSDWFNGIEILQGRWQHGDKVGYQRT
jgi:hypothetical protein